MSRETKNLDVSNIDFDDIRTNLKDFLRSQDTLQDYDFEGSAISTIVDLLSYVTHINAVNANLGINETFLDTAQFRGSVVGRAREKSYTPRSVRAPIAFLDLVVNNASSGQLLRIPRGHKFKSKIDNISYTFIATDDFTTTDATFTNVRIAQAKLRTVEYIFDTDSAEKFLIPESNVDTTTIRVEVFDSTTSTSSQIFVPIKSLTDIDSNTNGYFLDENPDGLFEISFGDGTIGTALENGNRVLIEYGTTESTAANGAGVFTMVDPIDSFTDVSITTAQPARGGTERESIDSIKRNAPLTFASQNRAVTPQDFEAIIRENFTNLDSVKAWGGENNDPPVYGKVFISVKPQNSNVLSNQEKTQIIEDIVTPKSVVTITPEIVDPDFVFISLDVFFKYDNSRTSSTRTELEASVRQAILDFNSNNLDQFNRVFRYSTLLSTVDDTSNAILNSVARVYVKKRFVPNLNLPNRYVLDFSAPLYETQGKENVIKSSTNFTINGTICRFKDVADDSNENRRVVQIISGEGRNEIVVKKNAGFIEGSRIVLENFSPTNFQGSFIEVEAIPNSNDIAPTTRNILTIDSNELTVLGEIDTIVAGSDFSGVDYSTTPRHG